MSLSRQIGRGAAIVSGASLLARVGTFLANLAIIRLLGRDLIGQLGLIESWFILASLFSLLGLDAGIPKFIAQYWQSDPQKVGGYAATSLVLGTLFSIAVSLLAWAAFSLGMFAHGEVVEIFRTYSGLFVILILITSVRQIMIAIIYGLQTFQVLVSANILVGLLSFPISYLLVKQHGLAGALEARFLLLLVEVIWLGWAMNSTLRAREVRLSLKNCLGDARELALFGFPTFIGQLASNPIQPFILTMLASQPGGIAQVGLITIARRLVGLVNFFPNSLASTLTPILSSEWGTGDKTRFREGALLTLRMCWLCALPITIFFLAGVGPILSRLYGADFVDAWPVTALLLFAALFTSLNETADRSFIAAGRVWLSTSNTFVWLALFTPLAWWLTLHQGAWGYALAFLLSFMMYSALQLGWLRRLFDVQIRSMVEMIGVSLLIGAAAWGVAASQQIAGAIVLTVLTLGIEARWFLNPSERAAFSRRFRAMGLVRRVSARFAKA